MIKRKDGLMIERIDGPFDHYLRINGPVLQFPVKRKKWSAMDVLSVYFGCFIKIKGLLLCISMLLL